VKNFILRISAPRISSIASIICAIFIIFFISPSYKSSSGLDVTSNGSNSFASSFTSSFISSGDSDAFQVKLYLESNEASDILRNKYEIESFYLKDSISFFSKFRDPWYQNFHEYLERKINITVDSNSNTLLIDTFAFTPKEAKILNLSLVDLTSDFLNKKARLAAINSRSGKVCELYLANSGLIGLELNELKFESETAINNVNSANQLLESKADSFKEYCLNKMNNSSNISGATDKAIINIPVFELRTINAQASKNIITEIYQDSMGVISEAEYIDVVAEPIDADKSESKLTFFISLIAYIITFLFLISIKIFIRLTDEFTL
jgi:capsular polysaccharide biosynthesis protein